MSVTSDEIIAQIMALILAFHDRILYQHKNYNSGERLAK